MATEENLARQRQLYGEPLANIAGRIRSELDLTQAGLAQVLGLSAPMISQLLSGQRAKIGNPAVLGRLQALVELCREAPILTPEQRRKRIKEIQEATPTISTSLNPAVRELHNAAPTEELLRLAELTTAPELTRLLRIAAKHG
jgi:putative DNA-binding protein